MKKEEGKRKKSPDFPASVPVTIGIMTFRYQIKSLLSSVRLLYITAGGFADFPLPSPPYPPLPSTLYPLPITPCPILLNPNRVIEGDQRANYIDDLMTRDVLAISWGHFISGPDNAFKCVLSRAHSRGDKKKNKNIFRLSLGGMDYYFVCWQMAK